MPKMLKNDTSLNVAVVLPDIHVPYQDTAALAVAMDIVKYVQPDQIVQVGDIIDFYPVSKYPKDPRRGHGTELQRELDETKKLIDKLAEYAPVTICKGNHEERLSKYLRDKAPGLLGLRHLTVQEQLGIDGKRVKYVDFMHLGALFVMHGDRVTRSGSSYSARTAQTNVDKLNMSVMHGHIHRLGQFNKTTRGGGDQVGYEIGCLCDRENVEYAAE
ncbi:MAG: metallophosphoesterase, partial [Dehalococcoidales bacterium]